jgi:2-polyprenyl-3-methyl-5-hydroxy-6-metoxy-1,4-benzoquinol methylase
MQIPSDRQIADSAVVISEVQAVVERCLMGNLAPRVLDAGCGSQRYLQLAGCAHIIGLDVDEEQLDRNTVIQDKILGDIQTFPLPAQSFDLVICWDVLEHVPRPIAALNNLAQALTPSGLLVLGGPNLYSLKGLITRITPYWFHRLVYRVYTRRWRSRSEPFRTYLRRGSSPRHVASWAAQHRLLTEYFMLHESPLQREFRRRIRMPAGFWSMLESVLRLLTSGRFELMATDFVLVLRR